MVKLMNLSQKSFVFMCKLRRRIADAGASGVLIDTIWGQGYIPREMRDYDAVTISA